MPLRSSLAKLGAVVLLVGLLAGCASDRNILTAESTSVTRAETLPRPTVSPATVDAQADYRIGRLDVVEVSVLQSADLNRTVRVSESGSITLPLIGALPAAGLTVAELQAEVTRKLAQNYLRDPQVTVFVKEYTSQRVTVEGSVNAPGVYPISGSATLLQTIAMAKGVDRIANRKGIIIFRTVEGKRLAAAYDLDAIRSGRMTDPAIYGDDVVVVDQSGRRAAWRDFLGGLPALGLFTVF